MTVMSHHQICMGQIQVKLIYGFTFLIINKLLVVCSLSMDKVLDLPHPWPKRLTFIS